MLLTVDNSSVWVELCIAVLTVLELFFESIFAYGLHSCCFFTADFGPII